MRRVKKSKSVAEGLTDVEEGKMMAGLDSIVTMKTV